MTYIVFQVVAKITSRSRALSFYLVEKFIHKGIDANNLITSKSNTNLDDLVVLKLDKFERSGIFRCL